MILTENKKRYESPLSEVVALRMEAILNNPSGDITPIGNGDEIPD